MDKRDAIRQIVEGYPDLKKITNIEFDDGHQAYKNEKVDYRQIRNGGLQPKDLTLNQLTPHSLPSASMASPAQASANGIPEASPAALRKGAKYLKPLKTTSHGAKGSAALKTNRESSMPNSTGSQGQQQTQHRAPRKTKKLGLNEQQNILCDSARRGLNNITAADQLQESSAEKVEESTTSIYKSGKNGRQRTRSKADRVYISSMILDAYEKEKR